jgi:hypothetical protein
LGNPLKDTVWNCYKYKEGYNIDGMISSSEEQSCNETWYFNKDGSFEISSARENFSGFWEYDEPILTIDTSDTSASTADTSTATFHVTLDGNFLTLELESEIEMYSLTYYLTREKDDSSFLDDLLPF